MHILSQVSTSKPQVFLLRCSCSFARTPSLLNPPKCNDNNNIRRSAHRTEPKTCTRGYTSLNNNFHRNTFRVNFRVRIFWRGYSTEKPEYENRSNAEFPSFSTKADKRIGNNFQGFITKLPLPVFIQTIVNGLPNSNGLAPAIFKKLNQTPDELLMGCSFAIEAITNSIASESLDEYSNENNGSKVKDQLTPDCFSRLLSCNMSMFDFRDRRYLISTPKEDIFFSWIQSINKDDNGSLEMKICTLSFPQYGYIIRRRNEDIKRRDAFREDTVQRGPNQDKDELNRRVMELNKTMYKPRKYIRSNDIVISNFALKRGPGKDDSWLIDEISMRNATEVYSKIDYHRWKGRMSTSILGVKFSNIFLLDCIYFGFLFPFISLIT